MATPNPITGGSYVSVGNSITLSESVTGGAWVSTDTTKATVSSTGVVTGVAVGSADIKYTVDGNSEIKTVNVVANMVSNGFDICRVLEAFQGRIGWPEPTIGGLPELNSLNTTSLSGRYYPDFHAAVTIKNLYDSQEDAGITDDEFNALLQRNDQSATMRCLNAVFNRPALIEKCLCYVRNYNLQSVAIANGGNAVGYRLTVAPGNYAVKFDAVSLYFNGAATFNLYLFNDLVKAPLAVKEVTTVANSQTRVSLDWVTNYITKNNLGGVFFICYFQNDLGDVQALDEQLNLWQNSKVFGGYPFQSTDLSANDVPDFNRRNPSVVYNSYGLNLEVSCYRDYTQMIVENVQLFDEVKGLAYAALVMETTKYTTRNNGTERVMGENLKDLDIDLNNAFPTQEQPYIAGIKSQLVRALKQLNENFWPKTQAKSVAIGGNNWGESTYLGFNINNLPPRNGLA